MVPGVIIFLSIRIVIGLLVFVNLSPLVVEPIEVEVRIVFRTLVDSLDFIACERVVTTLTLVDEVPFITSGVFDIELFSRRAEWALDRERLVQFLEFFLCQ